MLLGLLTLLLMQGEAPQAVWKVNEVKSEMDDQTTILLSRDGDRPISSFTGRETVPVVHLRCSGGQSDVMVFTGTAAKQGRYSFGDVRVRFDGDSARSILAKETNDHLNLVMDNRWVLDQMLVSKTLLFQFTPVSAAPQVVAFPLDGFADALKPHASACGVDMSEIGDPGVYILLVDSALDERDAKSLARKLSEKLKAESTLLPWSPGFPQLYVAVGRFANREEAVAFVKLALDKKVPSSEIIRVGKMNSKGTRLIDEPPTF